MNSSPNIAGHRTFLIGSVAVPWGVTFGTCLVKTLHDNPLADGLGAGAASFSPCINVTADRIILILPHADKGQGMPSAQAALIAEQLDNAAVSTAKSQAGCMRMPTPGPDSQIPAGAWNMPNLRVRAYRVPEPARISSWRAANGLRLHGMPFKTFVDFA